MQKHLMSWEELDRHCQRLADLARDYDPAEIIAVARKGLIPAFLIANILKKKVGFWYPVENKLCSFSTDRLMFVDDMVATGDTLLRLQQCFSNTDYHLATIFVDQKCHYRPDYFSFVASDWVTSPSISFPHPKRR